MKSILCLLPALLLVPAAEAATVAPHLAVYDLSLLRANEGATLQSAAGRLAFEIEGSTCEGFTVSFRMATKYRPKEGEVTLMDTTTTTFEGPGALDFRHQLKERIDNAPREDYRIKMTRATPEAEGQGTISSKPNEPFTVPAGALLPMQHQLRLMALGDAGGGRDSSVLFDGSDQGKSFRAISFVGKKKPPGSLARDAADPVAAPLKSLGSFPVSVSYFALDGSSEMPDYQVSFDMYENGVATGLVLDYGEFALSGKLADPQDARDLELPLMSMSSIKRHDGRTEPAATSDVEAFLARVREAPAPASVTGRGRLVLAMDATLSRQHSWDQAIAIQADMFAEAGRLNGLDMQLVYFRGHMECRASKWTPDTQSLARLMSGIRCMGGQTQILRVLKHVRSEAKAGKVNACVYIGDAMEGPIDTLAALAGEVGLMGVPVFMFQEGGDSAAEAGFREIARLTRGAYFRFGHDSAQVLRELLTAVAVYAAGGYKALSSHSAERGGAAALLLKQMK